MARTNILQPETKKTNMIPSFLFFFLSYGKKKKKKKKKKKLFEKLKKIERGEMERAKVGCPIVILGKIYEV